MVNLISLLFYFINISQAMECQIAGVVPVADSWSSECCMAARQLLSGKVLTIKLVDTLKNGYVHSVDIQLSAGWINKYVCCIRE